MNKLALHILSVVAVSAGFFAYADVGKVVASDASAINSQNTAHSSKSLNQQKKSLSVQDQQNKAGKARSRENGLKEGDVIYEINSQETSPITDVQRGDAMYNEHVEE